MTRRAEPRRTRAALLAKSALTGALAGWFGLIATQGHAGPNLPVQAPATPQVAGGNAQQPQISVTGATMTVSANAARTLIDWNSFTIAQGSAVNFTLNARSDIVLNRLVDSTPVMINGVLNSTVGGVAGGNIWFSAPGGVLFGSTAVVNVGGLLATTALPDVTSFLNPSNTSSLPFTYPTTGYPGTPGDAGGTYPGGTVTYPAGPAYSAITGAPTSNVAGGVGGVTVQNGASLTTNGGMLALVAPFVNVATGATITSADKTATGGGAGSVVYGAANAFTLSLTQETSGDLDMLQFVISQPSQVTDTPLLLHGATAGTNVYLAALTASGITGAVVDATGTLTATTASTGAGGEIILSTGADTIAMGQVPTFTAQSISPLQLNLGNVTAGGPLTVVSSGGINSAGVTGAILQSLGDMNLAAGGDIALNSARSGGSFTASAVGYLAFSASGPPVLTFGPPPAGPPPGGFPPGPELGLGAISATTITAGGSATLSGSSVTLGAVTAGNANGATGAITASAYDNQSGANAGAASVDLGAATAPGAISLTANDGYASLTSVNFLGSSASLNITAYGYNSVIGILEPVYFGYGPGGPSANAGAGPTPGIGAVTGSGAINLTSNGAANLNVAGGSGLVTVGAVNAGQTANLTADALTITGVVQGATGVNATARTGDLNAAEIDANNGDVNANATLGSVYLAATTANNLYVTANNIAHVDAATTRAALVDPINVTGATAYLGTGNSQDAINVTATNGNATAGDLTALGAITVSATNGAASLHSATAGTSTSTTSAMSVAVIASGPGGNVTIGGSNGAGTLGFVTGATSVTAQAAQDVTVNVAQPIELNSVTAGGNVTLTAPSLTLDSIQGALAGNLAITVTQAGFSDANPLTAGGDISISTSGPLSLGVAQAGGAFTATATTMQNGVTYGAGAINATSLTAGGAATLTGSSVTVGSLTAGSANGATGAVTVTALDTPTASNAGAAFVDIGTITAPGTMILSGDGYVSLTNVAFTGSGQSLSLNADVGGGGTPATLPAYFGYGSGGPTANSGAGPTAGVGTVTGTGTINLASNGDADLNVASGSGLVTVGAVTAGQTTNLVADSLTLTGTVQGSTAVNVTASTGALNAASLISANGDVNAKAPMGAASVANASGADVYVTGASAQLQSAISQGAVGVTGTNGGATAGDLTALGAITVSAANGAAALHSATAGTSTSAPSALTVLVSASGSGGNVLIGGPDSSGTVGSVVGANAVTAQAQQDVTVNVAQPITLTAVTAAGNVSLTAPALTLTSLQGALAGNIAVNVTNSAFADANPLTAGGGVSVTASGGLALGQVTAQTGAINLASGGPLSLATAQAGGSFTASATTMQNGATYGAGAVTATTVTAGGAVTLTGSSVKVGSITAGSANGATGAVTATALDTTTASNAGAAFVDVGSITAPGTITLSGDGYASLTNVTFTGSAQSLNINADVTTGATPAALPAYFGYASGGPSANNGAGPTAGVGTVTGTGTINLASNGDVDLNVAAGSGLVALGTISAGRNVSLTAPTLTLAALQNVPTGNITINVTQGGFVYGNIRVSGPRGFTFPGPLTAGGNLSLTASGALAPGPLVAQAGTITLSAGGDITLTTAQAGGSITAAATTAQIGVTYGAGAITATSLTAGGAATLTGSSVKVGSITSGGAVTATALDTLTGSNAGAAFVDVGSLTAPGTISLSGDGYVSLTSVNFTGSGQSLNLSADVSASATPATLPVYLGYASGGPTANGGAGPTPGVGTVTGTGTINLASKGDVDLNVTSGSGLITLGAVQGGSTGNIALTVAQGGITDANPLTAGRNLTVAAGGPVTLGQVTAQAGAINLAATTVQSGVTYGAGAITATSLTAGGAATLTGSSVKVGTITSRGAVTATALDTSTGSNAGNAFVDIGSVTAPGTITLSGDGYASLTNVTFTGSGQSLNISADVGASATPATKPVYVGYASGGPSANSGAGPTAGVGTVTGTGTINLASKGDVDVAVASGSSAVTLGTVSASGNVNLTAPTLTLASLQGALAGNIGVTVANGGFAYAGPLTAGGNVTIAASGPLSLGQVTAQTGAINLAATTAQNGVTSGAGAITATSLTAGGAATLTGSSLKVGTITSGGAVTATALDTSTGSNAGNAFVDIGTVTAPGTITLSGDGYASLTNVTFTGSGQSLNLSADVSTSATPATLPVYLGYASGGPSANGGAGPTAGVGTVTGTGTINLASKGDVDLNVTSGSGLITLGAVSGGSTGNINLTVAQGGITDANPLTAGGALTVAAAGPLTLGQVTAQTGAINLAATTVQSGVTYGAGAITATSLTAGGAATLTGSSVKVGAITSGGAVTATALDTSNGSNAGNAFVDVGSITAPGTITLSGDGYASLTNVTFTGSGQSLTLNADSSSSATQPVYLGYASGGPSTNSGAGPTGGVGTVTGTGTINLASNGDVDVAVANTSGTVALGTVSAGGNLSLTAPTLTLASLQGALAGNIGVTVTNGGFAYAGPVTAGGSLSLLASGGLTLGQVAAQGGNITLSSGGPLSLATAQASGSITATATTAQNGVISGAGAITAASLTSGGAATLTGSSVKVGTITSGGAVMATALDTSTGSNAGNAFVDIGSVTAPGTITLSGDGYASLTNVTFTGSGQSLNISADVGASATPATKPVYVGFASGGPSANGGAGPTAGVGTVTGTGTINLASKGDVDVSVANTSGTVSLGTVSASGNVNLTAPTLTLASLQGALAGNIGVTVANGGFAYAGPLTAGGGLSLIASGGLTLGQVASQGGNITLSSGGPLSLTTAQASGSITATATTVQNGVTSGAGAITATSLTAGGAATLSGSSIKVGSITAGGAVTATGLDTSTGSNVGNAFVDIGTVTAPGTITLSGDGYASLTNVTFTGSGQSLNLNADSSSSATQPVYLGYASGGPTANGGAGPTPGVGTVTGTGTINLASKGDVDLNVTSGSGLVTLGAVSGGSAGNINLTVAQGGITDANPLTAGGALTVAAAGPLTLGQVTAQTGAISLAATTTQNGVTSGAGAITATSLTAGGAASLTGSSVKIGTITSRGAVTATALDTSTGSNAGNAFVDIGSVTAPGTITLSGDGYASLTNVTFTGSGQSLTLNADSSSSATPATLPVYLGYASGGPTANNGAGPTAGVGTVAGTGTINLASKGDVDVAVANTSGTVALGTVSAGGNVNLTAPTLTLASLQGALAGNIGVTVANGGFAYAGPLTAGGNVTIAASGPLSLGQVTAQTGAINLAATTVQSGVTYGAGAITATSLNAGGAATLTGSSIKVGSITSGGAVTATALDTSTGSNAGNAFVDIGSVTAPGTITLSGDGYASLTNVTFTGSGQSLNISADVGASATPATLPVYLGYASGGPTANNGAGPTAGVGTVTGTGTINLASKGDVDVSVANNSGGVTLGTVSVGRNVNLTVPTLVLGALSAPAGAVAINVTQGAFTDSNPLTAGGALSVSAAGAITAASLNAGGAATLTGSSVKVGTITSGGAVMATALDTPTGSNAGNAFVDVGSITAPGTITLSGDGYVSLTSVNFTGSGQSLNVSADVGASATPATKPVYVGYASGGPSANSGAGPTAGVGTVTGTGTINLASKGDVDVAVANTSGTVSLGTVSASGNVNLTAPTLTLASLQGALAGNIGVTVANGSFAYAGPLTAGGNVTIAASGPLTLGQVTAQTGAINLAATTAQNGVTSGAGAITAASLTAGGAATLTGSSVKVGTIASGGAVTATALDTSTGSNVGNAFVDIGTVTAPGTITLSGDGYVSLTSVNFTGSGQSLNISADVSSSATQPVYLGYASGGPTANNGAGPTAGAGAVTGTGTINLASKGDVDVAVANTSSTVTLGPVSAGRNVTLTAPTLTLGALSAPAGNIGVTVTQGGLADSNALTAAGTLTVAASGAVNLGAVNSGAGAVSLAGASVATGALTAQGPVTATATSGAVTLASITTPAAATLSGAGVTLPSGKIGGDLTVVSGADANLGSVTIGGALALDAAGQAAITNVAATGAGRVTASTLNVATNLSAPTLTIESVSGVLTVGGSSAPASGMWISPATFAALQAGSALNLYAGSATGTARGALVISDLSPSPTSTPNLAFFAAPGQTVSVTGAVTPTSSGVNLTIGSLTNSAWMPSSILISGSLGASTRVTGTTFTNVQALRQVTLASSGDVLIGSPRFISLIQATPASGIDIANNQPNGVAPVGAEVGKVYVTAGELVISATGKVVQQNTSGASASASGLYLLNGVNSNNIALSIDPPVIVDLFGTIVNASGVPMDQINANQGSGVQLATPTPGQVPTDYRFGGCEFFTGCGAVQTAEAAVVAQPLGPVAQQSSDSSSDSGSDSGSGSGAAGSASPSARPAPVAIAAPPTATEEEVDPLVTGVGNEEIWRKRRTAKEKDQ